MLLGEAVDVLYQALSNCADRLHGIHKERKLPENSRLELISNRLHFMGAEPYRVNRQTGFDNFASVEIGAQYIENISVDGASESGVLKMLINIAEFMKSYDDAIFTVAVDENNKVSTAARNVVATLLALQDVKNPDRLRKS